LAFALPWILVSRCYNFEAGLTLFLAMPSHANYHPATFNIAMSYHLPFFSYRHYWLVIIISVLVTGCGQPGPLYLPGKPQTVQPTVKTQPQLQPASPINQ
jgi:predicted small lipoprotein YifL